MNEMIYIIIGLFVISIVIELVLSTMKRKARNQLTTMLLNKEFEEFDRLINEKKTKFFVPVFNSLMLQLHKAIMLNDKAEIKSIMKKLNFIKMNEKQKTFFYSKAFSYYISNKDHSNVEKYYKLISSCEETPAKRYIEMVYDTVVQHGYKYIDDAKILLKNANDEDKINIHLLIANMYENMGDMAQAKAYYGLASE